VPLGGGRVSSWAFNLALVFIVSGLWHGAGWNFILWGAVHAGYLIFLRSLPKFAMQGWCAWLLTMVAVFFSWLFFYDPSLGSIASKIFHIMTPADYAPNHFQAFVASIPPEDRVSLLVLALLVVATLWAEWRGLRSSDGAYSPLCNRWIQAFLLVAIVFLSPGRNNGFVYFAF
jgi:D-alanyl-lipoteichoic acid acyltransferase DltB (MBOAT superfamily)